MKNLKKLNICIAGLGNIGSNLVKIIDSNQQYFKDKLNVELNILGISAKDKLKKRNFNIDKFNWFENPIEMTNLKNCDVLIELIGEEKGISYDLIKKALAKKIHVVTANKALLSKNGDKLFALAENNKVFLLFEAAVCGGIPVIKTIKQSLQFNKINKISGILNGTTNYILSEMENKNLSFDETLKEAQLNGYAESDSTNDLEGIDSAHKLSLLNTLCFSSKINFDNIFYKGITDIQIEDIQNAKKLGYKIKLISESEIIDDKISSVVEPRLLKEQNYLANVNGVLNAVKIYTNLLNPVILEGEGAGGKATSSSILSDLFEILKNPLTNSFGFNLDNLHDHKKLDLSNSLNSYYLRIIVKDITGVLAKITSNLNEQGISIETILQIPENNLSDGIPIIIVTHETKKNLLLNALNKIEKLDFILSKIAIITIDKSID